MNILIVASPIVSLRRPFKGGTESFIVDLANVLVVRGNAVDVIAADADETDFFQCIELEQSSYSMKDFVHDEEYGQKYYRALQLGLMDLSRYDLVHMNSYLPILYDLAYLKKIPMIVTLHSPPDSRLTELHRLHSSRSNNTKYVAVSERLENSWRSIISSPIAIVPNGIDVLKWYSSCETVRTNLAWVGRICRVKNPKDAILIAKALNAELIVAGPVADKQYFNEHVEPYLSDKIRYKGHLNSEDLRQILNACHTLLATAVWNEPFGLTILECLSLGLRVVGYSTAIPPELRNNSSVYVSHSNTPEDIINYLKSHEVSQTSRHKDTSEQYPDPAGYFFDSRKHAEKFNLELMCDRYEKTYRNALV